MARGAQDVEHGDVGGEAFGLQRPGGHEGHLVGRRRRAARCRRRRCGRPRRAQRTARAGTTVRPKRSVPVPTGSPSARPMRATSRSSGRGGALNRTVLEPRRRTRINVVAWRTRRTCRRRCRLKLDDRRAAPARPHHAVVLGQHVVDVGLVAGEGSSRVDPTMSERKTMRRGNRAGRPGEAPASRRAVALERMPRSSRAAWRSRRPACRRRRSRHVASASASAGWVRASSADAPAAITSTRAPASGRRRRPDRRCPPRQHRRSGAVSTASRS